MCGIHSKFLFAAIVVVMQLSSATVSSSPENDANQLPVVNSYADFMLYRKVLMEEGYLNANSDEKFGIDRQKFQQAKSEAFKSAPHQHDLEKLRQRTVRMFYHAYDSYMRYAFPMDELRPLSCSGINTWGSYSLTLVDALDTLALLGNYSEFRRAASLLLQHLEPMANVNVSLFETNIRIVGGLLSAHLLSQRAGMATPGWPCSGQLLDMAERFARRLLPAFETKTGMPYGTVNLLYGVPQGETSVTCTACAGTLILEFATLSRLTADPVFEQVAMRSLEAIFARRSNLGLVGNHIDVQRDKWTALEAGIGSAIDSYIEYLAKGAVLLHNSRLMEMFNAYKESYKQHVKVDDWYVWVHMDKGHITSPIFQSLDAFWPGLLSLIGENDQALRTLHNYHQVWKSHGFLPEFYNVAKGQTVSGREAYPLRPELAESVYYLYRASTAGDNFTILQMGVDIVHSIESTARTQCGFATVHNVLDHSLEDRMESFFLAETVKYLYLLFTPDHWLHTQHKLKPQLVDTPSGKCQVWAGQHVFNTEAHPIDAGCLQCCHGQQQEVRRKTLSGLESELSLIDALGLNTDWLSEQWLLSHDLNKYSHSTSDDAFNGTADEQQQLQLQQQNLSQLACPLASFMSRLSAHGQVIPVS